MSFQNSLGLGKPSTPTTSTEPLGLPGSPVNLTVTKDLAGCLVGLWDPPLDTGGPYVSIYTVASPLGTRVVPLPNSTWCGWAQDTWWFTVVATTSLGSSSSPALWRGGPPRPPSGPWVSPVPTAE